MIEIETKLYNSNEIAVVWQHHYRCKTCGEVLQFFSNARPLCFRCQITLPPLNSLMKSLAFRIEYHFKEAHNDW